MTRQEEEGVLVYSSQSIWVIQLRSNGYGGFYERGKKKTPRNGTVYGIEFNEIKHPKEDKLPNGTGGFSFGNPYVYGKINNFYSLQLRSEEHTSELQSQSNLVCRLLLEKKKKYK